MCLLRNDNTALYVGFEEAIHLALDPWVAENVVPVLHSSPIPPRWLKREAIQAAIAKFLAGDVDVVIVTDWPDDVTRFSELLLTAPDKMLANETELPRLTFKIERVDAYPTEVPIAVRYNALWDCIALRHKLDAGE